MAEGIFDGVLREEDEQAEVQAPSTLAAADDFAVGEAFKRAGNDPGVARKTEIFLDKQAQLLETQNKHLEEERALRLTQLHNQTLLLQGQRRGQVFRTLFQALIALIAILVVVGIAVMLLDAFTSRSVVIEPFESPPALAARGMTGIVVASNLLDKLRYFQSVNVAARSSDRELRNAWSGEAQISIPEVGISIGEVSRLLRARLGHDLHISGELVQDSKDALALTVRGDGVSSKTFVAGPDAIDKLTAAAAEYVYGQAQPAQWTMYLATAGRNEEAIDFARGAFWRTNKADRPRLLVGRAVAMTNVGQPREALRLARQASALDPQLFDARYILMYAMTILGDEEGVLRAGEDMRQAAGGRPGRAAEGYYRVSDLLTFNLQANRDALVADLDSKGDVGRIFDEELKLADVYAGLHDPAAAELAIEAQKDDPSDPNIPALTHFVHGELAAEAGDPIEPVSEMEAFGAMCADLRVSAQCARRSCWIAPAEEAVGQPGKADAALKVGGAFVDCYRFRGDILNHRDDSAGVNKAYADALALAPDSPAAYYSWGIALARNGELTDAEARLKDAHQRGPHWADPLKAWGDVLVRQGRVQEALLKYDEALVYAPTWATLKAARAGLTHKSKSET
jgi:tetratricopeptide (TPR) repeat protein